MAADDHWQTLQKYVFYVRGVKFTLSNKEDPLEKLVEPYYWHGENILVATPSFSGKTQCFTRIFNEIQSNKKIIVSNSKIDGFPSIKETQLILNDNIHDHNTNKHGIKDDRFNPDDFEYIIYNNIIPKYYGSAHISIFIDYSNISFNRMDMTAYRNILKTLVPSNFTIICAEPPIQRVEFVFGTNDKIKHISISQLNNEKGTIAFSYKHVNPNIENVNFVTTIGSILKCKKFIFYDINLGIFEEILDRIENIVVVYTEEDILNLHEICKILDSRKIPVPEHIRRISSSV